MKTDHHPSLSYRSRLIASRVDAMLEVVCGYFRPEYPGQSIPNSLYDDDYLDYMDRLISRIGRVGFVEVRPEFKRYGDTYLGMPIVDFVKEAERHGFDIIATLPSDMEGAHSLLLGKRDPTFIILVWAKDGAVLDAQLTYMAVIDGSPCECEIDCHDGLNFTLDLEMGLERERADHWCRKGTKSLSDITGLLITSAEFEWHHGPGTAKFRIDVDWCRNTDSERRNMISDDWRDVLDLDMRKTWVAGIERTGS